MDDLIEMKKAGIYNISQEETNSRTEDVLRFYLSKECYMDSYYRIIHNVLQNQYVILYCEDIGIVYCTCVRDLNEIWYGECKEKYGE